MIAPERLFLFLPDQQPTPDANLRNLVDFIYAALTRPSSKRILGDLLEIPSHVMDGATGIWYWFNPDRRVHHIAFWSDHPKRMSPTDSDDPKWWFPTHFYFCVIEQYLPHVDQFDADLKRHSQIVNLWVRIAHHPFSEFESTLPYDFTAKIKRKDCEDGIAQPNLDAEDTDWTATLLFAERLKDIPAVPIPKAARLLDVDERTIRYQITKKILEGVRRKGSLWVTQRSIASYVKNHYHATAEFNVWKEVVEMARMKKRK